jgi:hypothetical protein
MSHYYQTYTEYNFYEMSNPIKDKVFQTEEEARKYIDYKNVESNHYYFYKRKEFDKFEN